MKIEAQWKQIILSGTTLVAAHWDNLQTALGPDFQAVREFQLTMVPEIWLIRPAKTEAIEKSILFYRISVLTVALGLLLNRCRRKYG